MIAPLIISTWNDPVFHNFSSVFGTTCFYLEGFFSPMLYNLGEDYKGGHNFAL